MEMLYILVVYLSKPPQTRCIIEFTPLNGIYLNNFDGQSFSRDYVLPLEDDK